MYDSYIHSYGPRPPGRIPAMLMKKSCYHVTFAAMFWILLRNPFGSMRDPVLESSPECKRAASVNIDSNVTRLQSVLETKWGR